METIGWSRICVRAERAINELPADAVLAGISMGAGVVASLWPHRVDAKGILLLHGLAAIPENARRSLPVEVHLAEPDDWCLALKGLVGDGTRCGAAFPCRCSTIRGPDISSQMIRFRIMTRQPRRKHGRSQSRSWRHSPSKSWSSERRLILRCRISTLISGISMPVPRRQSAPHYCGCQSHRSFISPSLMVSGGTGCHAVDEIIFRSATQRVPSS
jgi:hypothetical protein